MLLSIGLVWLACAAIFLELADRAPVYDEWSEPGLDGATASARADYPSPTSACAGRTQLPSCIGQALE